MIQCHEDFQVNSWNRWWNSPVNLAMPIMIAVKHPQIAQKGSKIDNFSNGFGLEWSKYYLWKSTIIKYSLTATNSSALWLLNNKCANIYFRWMNWICIFSSRPSLDVYEYNSEETNVDKVFREIVTEEKRSHSRAGCDCQLSVSLFRWKKRYFHFEVDLKQFYDQIRRHNFILFQTTLIDLGPTAFPRHIRNVTCDEHKKCYHSRNKGLHCLPIHYQVCLICMHATETEHK